MSAVWKGSKIIALVSLFFCLGAQKSFAEKKNPLACGQLAPRTLNSLPPLTSPRDSSDFYRVYIQNTDASVSQIYRDRWDYQEKMVPYVANYRYEHVSIGTLDYFGRAPDESMVRAQFAQQVFRMRMDAAIRTYIQDPERPDTLRRAGRTLESLKDYHLTVKTSSAPNKTSASPSNAQTGKPDAEAKAKATPPAPSRPDPFTGELRVAYDFTSDASKFQYVTPVFEGGLVQPHVLGALMGARSWEPMGFTATARMGENLPSASVNYQPTIATLQMSVYQPLSNRVSAVLSSIQPMNDNASLFYPQSYDIRFIYNF